MVSTSKWLFIILCQPVDVLHVYREFSCGTKSLVLTDIIIMMFRRWHKKRHSVWANTLNKTCVMGLALMWHGVQRNETSCSWLAHCINDKMSSTTTRLPVTWRRKIVNVNHCKNLSYSLPVTTRETKVALFSNRDNESRWFNETR